MSSVMTDARVRASRRQGAIPHRGFTSGRLVLRGLVGGLALTFALPASALGGDDHSGGHFRTEGPSDAQRLSQSESKEARRLLQQGKDAFAAGRYDDAAKLFERAYLADETLTLALYNRAFALRKAGKLDDARAAYLAYVSRAPDDHDGLFGLAETERLLRHDDDARRLFAEYLRRDARPEKAKYREYAEKKIQELSAGPSSTSEKPASTRSDDVDGMALAAQADVDYREGRFDAAATGWAQALEKLPARHDLVYRRALALRKASKLADAEAAYRAYAEKVPDDLDGLFGLAETLRLAGKAAEASTLFATYVARENRADRAKYVSYAKAHMGAPVVEKTDTPAKTQAVDAAKVKEAARLFDEGLKLHGKGEFMPAAERFQQALALDPSRADALYRRGLALRKANRLDDAKASYTEFLRARIDDADGLYGLAETERLRGDVPAARSRFQRYVEVENRPSEAKYVERARAYLAETAGQVAIVKVPEKKPHVHVADGDLTSAAFANRVTADGLVKHGEEALKSGDHAKADSHFALAVALDPGNARAHFLRGQAKEAQGALDDAKSSYEAAIAAATDDATKQEFAAALAGLGKSPSKASSGTVSIERVARANERLREAQARHAAKDHVAALIALDEAVRENPTLFEAYALAGDIHLETRSGVKALSAYQRALAADASRAAPLYGIARAYEILGEVRAARHHFQLYVDSQAADVDEALRRDAWLRLEGAR
jgi:tetratricopeptide (TPR) repeat protein